jgi:hypothetical protein
MSKQTTSHILMVRPANFGFNDQTAESNAFQTNDTSFSQREISNQAIVEFDGMVAKLRSVGVNVHVVEDSPTPIKPDAIFPNNWVSFHDNGTIITYPMFTPNRQAEIREDVLEDMKDTFVVKKRVRFNRFSGKNLFLEGTGSMILDRENRIVYACVSARTEENLLHNFAEWADYEPLLFLSVDSNGLEIYHTNVMMAIGETFAIICMDSIKEEADRVMVRTKLEETNKEIIDISYEQMLSFAGNMLQVSNDNGANYLIMSQQAYKSLNTRQIEAIEDHTKILACQIDTIENYGGGSARCMMAEVFLPVKNK